MKYKFNVLILLMICLSSCKLTVYKMLSSGEEYYLIKSKDNIESYQTSKMFIGNYEYNETEGLYYLEKPDTSSSFYYDISIDEGILEYTVGKSMSSLHLIKNEFFVVNELPLNLEELSFQAYSDDVMKLAGYSGDFAVNYIKDTLVHFLNQKQMELCIFEFYPLNGQSLDDVKTFNAPLIIGFSKLNGVPLLIEYSMRNRLYGLIECIDYKTVYMSKSRLKKVLF